MRDALLPRVTSEVYIIGILISDMLLVFDSFLYFELIPIQYLNQIHVTHIDMCPYLHLRYDPVVQMSTQPYTHTCTYTIQQYSVLYRTWYKIWLFQYLVYPSLVLARKYNIGAIFGQFRIICDHYRAHIHQKLPRISNLHYSDITIDFVSPFHST